MADERITEGMKHQLGDLRRKLDRDERPLGYKLGFGTEQRDEEPRHRRAARRPPGHGQPARVGRRGRHLELGNPKLEPEIVARAGDNGEITAIGAAIELVDLDTSIRDPQAILEANIFHRHVLLGPVSEGADPADAKLTVVIDGEEVATADDVTEATGDSTGSSKHVAGDAQGRRRRARARRHGDLRLDRPRARHRAGHDGRGEAAAARQPDRLFE